MNEHKHLKDKPQNQHFKEKLNCITLCTLISMSTMVKFMPCLPKKNNFLRHVKRKFKKQESIIQAKN